MISQTSRIVRCLFSTLVVATISGCASHDTYAPTQSQHSTPAAVAIAMQQIGVPYRYGGATPSGVDCSGLVHYSYARAGQRLPRTTATLWSELRPVAKSNIESGDILFFRISGKMSHVGLYIGNDQFVHAPSSGRVVSVASLRSDFYRDAFIRAGRPN